MSSMLVHFGPKLRLVKRDAMHGFGFPRSGALPPSYYETSDGLHRWFTAGAYLNYRAIVRNCRYGRARG
ncbi:hypothetical protein ACVKSY_000289 [Sphingomonas sp. PvP107]|jgi:hypothetical protein